LIIKFLDRDFLKPLYFPGVIFEVRRLEWEIEGGCSRAVVAGKGKAEDLQRLVQLLRCAAVVSTDQGGPTWWGFVLSVRVTPSGVRSGGGLVVSLDGMANRVAVRYRDERPQEGNFGGWQYQTAWLEDAAGVAEYGKKEKIFSIGEAQTSEASAFAAAELARLKRPVYEPSMVMGSAQEVVLELRGWWSTLGWTFFEESRGRLGFMGGGSSNLIGNVAANTAYAESITTGAAGWTASGLWLKVAKEQAPADNLYFDLLSNSAGAPNTLLARATVAAASLPGDMAWTKGDFATPYALAAATTYWVKISRSGAADVVNHYRLSLDQGLVFAGGTGLLYNGGAWAARAVPADMPFLLVGQETTTNQVLSMAAAAAGGQFLTSVFIKDASTVQARLYRSGIQTALQEVREMLSMGTSGGGRLMAWISEERVLVVESVPSESSPEYLVKASGQVARRDGGRMPAAGRLVGRWARVDGLGQAGGDAGPAGAVLISRAIWDPDGRLRVSWK
jgi:hypothetical protein